MINTLLHFQAAFKYITDFIIFERICGCPCLFVLSCVTGQYGQHCLHCLEGGHLGARGR